MLINIGICNGISHIGEHCHHFCRVSRIPFKAACAAGQIDGDAGIVDHIHFDLITGDSSHFQDPLSELRFLDLDYGKCLRFDGHGIHLGLDITISIRIQQIVRSIRIQSINDNISLFHTHCRDRKRHFQFSILRNHGICNVNGLCGINNVIKLIEYFLQVLCTFYFHTDTAGSIGNILQFLLFRCAIGIQAYRMNSDSLCSCCINGIGLALFGSCQFLSGGIFGKIRIAVRQQDDSRAQIRITGIL